MQEALVWNGNCTKCQETVLAKEVDWTDRFEGLFQLLNLMSALSIRYQDHTQAVKILLDDLIRFDIIQILRWDYRCGPPRRCWWREYFEIPALVDDEVLRKVEELSLLAPLHNPANAAGIRAFRDLSNITSVVVFDTSFHTTMPEKAYRALFN